MTSSPEIAPAVPETLPPALASMWRLCKLGYQHEPALIVTAFTLALVAALPDALLAYWFKLLGEGVVSADWSRVRFAPAFLLAVALRSLSRALHFERSLLPAVTRRSRERAESAPRRTAC